ncbi:MAG: ABC transporter substrate-binding protein [Gammaproteobacteria bacterium]|nr:ABC transporter substrate-binding protein [Gammaproteobacteria bacterium]
MLKKSVFIYTLIIMMLCLIPWVVSAEDKTPHEIIEQTSTEVLAALKNDSSEIKSNPNKINELVEEIILPICDLERMGKYILAKHWKTATDEQRDSFVTEFKQMLIRNYGKHLAEYSNATVTVVPEKLVEEKLYQTVSTKLDTRIGSKPFQVDYVFRVTEDSSKVVDVRVEGMSILKTFRTVFAQEIAETSLDELIQRITLVNQPSLAMNAIN